LLDNKDNTKDTSKISNKLLVSFKLIKYLFKENFDVILVYGYYFPHLIVLILAKLLGKKTVIRSVSYNLGKRNLIKRFLRHCYYRFANFFVGEFWSNGNLNTEFFKNFGAKENKISLIPSSQINKEFVFKHTEDFDIQKKNTISQIDLLKNKKIILYAGKFLKKKRPIFLLEAFMDAKINDDWVLLLAGGGGFYHNEVLNFINKKKSKNILFVGYKDLKEMLVLYDMSEIVVLPSDFGETHGNVLLEASQFNCALIASNRVGLYPELLNNHIGLVFEASNKKDLTKKIEELTNDNNLREKLKKNNLEYSKKIQPSYAANKICEILKKNEL
jgi:glycosyltransferase involved in cell wall biosynthesis